jgi:response regulator of citrate/malate metabolism
VTEDSVRQVIKQSDDPFVTASEVADAIGVARQTAHRNLQRLHENGRLAKRKIGGSAVIWWFRDGEC